MFAYSSSNRIFLQNLSHSAYVCFSLAKALIMPTAPKTPAAVAPKSPTHAKAGAPTLAAPESPTSARAAALALTAAEFQAELEAGNLDSYSVAVAENRPLAPPIDPKGVPGPSPKPVAAVKPPPAEVLADLSVPPKGPTLTPPMPIQFATSPSASSLAPPPAEAPLPITNDPVISEYGGTEVAGADVDWCSLFNVGVKELAVLLGAEIRHNIQNYREGHTYLPDEFDMLVDVFRDMVIAARKCDEIRWKCLDPVLDLLLSDFWHSQARQHKARRLCIQ
jgi:hypothetical protein